MQQQHYEEHMDAFSVASKDQGHEHGHGHDHRGRKRMNDRVNHRRSNGSFDDRPVVYNANPPDFASPLPGELDDNDDGSMFSPLSMASATPSSGIKAMQSHLSNKLARAAGKEKLKKKSRSGDNNHSAVDDNYDADEAEAEDDDINSRGSKVRFHVGGRGHRSMENGSHSAFSGMSAHETDHDVGSIGGSSQTSKNSRTRDKGRGSSAQSQGPLWLAEVLETDSSEQGLVMMYAEGFSMYMVEQGMIPE
jgi:hypothetical protein